MITIRLWPWTMRLGIRCSSLSAHRITYLGVAGAGAEFEVEYAMVIPTVAGSMWLVTTN